MSDKDELNECTKWMEVEDDNLPDFSKITPMTEEELNEWRKDTSDLEIVEY